MRLSSNHLSSIRILFQSTHLLRGATVRYMDDFILVHISIHAPLTRCDMPDVRKEFMGLISIHAPLTRCDKRCYQRRRRKAYFNPRTSYEVRPAPRCQKCCNCNFNPRTSYEVRPFSGGTIKRLFPISIHAPLTRCDLYPSGRHNSL